jgi:hypothetical protein
LRAQSVQRLQAGLFGLAAIVLVVGLANIINDRARQTEAGQGAGAAVEARADQGVQTDPLADIGVVPSATPDTQATSAPQGSAASNN